ncbi:hypothetical protein KGQ20_05185 [Catenulispora sp. NF23]|uniref:hypothetical protein n=1 Tax=Catenulispora pinistramenti TaxID=2705254 RepID=UPI001BA87CE2|nr:hypothetical protein [Catenulispora pinistramenti]MBS2532160.1 hypothetical protein [Catenulispora pinistramenti]
MRSAILGTVLTVAAGLAVTAPPRAEAAVLVASCTATLSGSWSAPLDPGSTNAAQPETLQQSGPVGCFDDGGAPLVGGTMTRTTVLLAAQCTGIAYSDPSTTFITWSDGTVSTLSLGQAAVVTVLGNASTNGSGSMAPASAKFGGDAIDGAVMTTGPGCGTASGQTNVTSTVVFTLAR